MLRHLKFALALAAAAFVAAQATAGTNSARTATLYVSDMHCGHCAQKIASRIYTVAGVVSVKYNVPKGALYIEPQQQRDPSPRALWEAVEKAEFTPVKLACPQGTFTSKPGS